MLVALPIPWSGSTPRSRIYHFAGTRAHRVYNALKLDDAAVAGSLDDPAAMQRDGWVDKVAAKGAEPGENSLLVRARKPREADDVEDKESP